MMEFWINLVLAILMNKVNLAYEESSMTSDNPAPIVTQGYEWPCDVWGTSNTDDEMCYIIIENGKVIDKGP
jgi:hypothetical protein